MTMHLVRGMSTTSNKKPRIHLNKAEQRARDKALLEQNKLLESLGIDPHRTIHPENFRTYEKTEIKESKATHTQPMTEPLPQFKDGGKRKNQKLKVYSGKQKLLGIAVMHKSNLVPVFDKKDAEDIAKMRR